MSKLNLKKDKEIKEENYITKEQKKILPKEQIKEIKQEYKFDKNTDFIPKKNNRLLCIIFTEDKGCYFLARKINIKQNFFRFKKGRYLIDNESIHLSKNGNRIAFYLQGISTPIKMSNIEHEFKDIEYIDLQGNTQQQKVKYIKGLKFDASILDTFCDEHFADDFTKSTMDNFQIYILILVIISLIISVAGICVSYFFR